jgi:hypothetical protein
LGKVVKTIAVVVGVAALVLTGVGLVMGPVAFAASGITAALGGITAGMLSAAAGVLSIGASLLAKRPKGPSISEASLDRLKPTLDPRASRKAVFGTTALGGDMRDHEVNPIPGTTDNQWVDRFFVHAGHKITSLDEIWFDDEKVWSGGAVVGGSSAAGYLTVNTRTEGNAGNAINISARAGTTRRYTGCGYTHLRFQISSKSPYASNIPQRIVFKGKGMPVYDPRKDSTVPGGSGTQRADDQSTWTFDSGGNLQGDNPACQLLTWLLGWRIQNPTTLAWKLSVGRGIPKDRINLASFITAANDCDVAVSLSAGGTEKRYRAAAIVGENEDTTSVVDRWKAAMNATLDDMDGQIRIQVLVNDLGAPIATFTEKDVVGEYTWQPFLNLTEGFNVIRGNYVNAAKIFEMTEYPEISLASPDAIERVETVSYDMVQSSSQAQRLSKQRLQRMQYPGMWEGTLQVSGWQVTKGDIIAFTFGPCGFLSKLFRVADLTHRPDGLMPVKLREENAAIYQWDTTQEGAVGSAPAVAWNPLLNPWNMLVNGSWAADLFGGDTNRVRYSLMEKAGAYGWKIAGTATSVSLQTGIFQGLPYVSAYGPASVAGQAFSVLSNDGLSQSRVPVFPGERICVQAKIGATANSWNFKVNFYDSAGAFLSNISLVSGVGDLTYQTLKFGFATVPANAYFASIELAGITSVTTTQLVIQHPMISSAAVDQIDPPAFAPGPSNEPAADVTALNAAIGDGNRVRYSRFEAGTLGWAVTYNPSALSVVLASAPSSGYQYIVLQVAFTANAQQASLGTVVDAKNLMPCTPGERIWVGARIGTSFHSAAVGWSLVADFRDAAGAIVAQTTVASAIGGLTFATPVGGFVTVPAGAKTIALEAYLSSNAGGAGGSALYVMEPIVTSAGINQLIAPIFSPGPSGESGADVTTNIVGPAKSDVLYDNAGTTFQSADDLIYRAANFFGTITTGIVTWYYRIISGTFNGNTSASGSINIPTSSAVGTLTPTALTTETAELEITCTVNGRTLPKFTTIVTKQRASAPAGGGGGGGGGGSNAQTSGFTAINTATFTTITGVLTLTLPAGKTTLRCTIDLTNKYPKTANQAGPWDVEYKVQRDISGTYTDQGSIQHSNPDNYLNEGSEFTTTVPGTMQAVVDMTGLTAGATYNVRLQARVASGVLPTNGVNMAFSAPSGGVGVALSAP